MRRYVLTITCPDRIGIVAAVTGFIAGHGGSVLEAAQHGDLSSGRFFLRIEVTAESLDMAPDDFRTAFAPLADEFAMTWQLSDSAERKRVVILVSREEHCVADLLYRYRSGDLECEVVSVVSNHQDLRSFVEWHGLPYRWVPMGTEPAVRRAESFAELERLVGADRPDVIVLARFMQILPDSFCAAYPGRIINIHHSFLPSFAGARPYHQAFARGVKLIGATCHYVTPDLDAGPIIEQDTRRIDHADSPDELRRVGRDIERTVLARGLRWHLEDRVLVNGSKTVVFA
jgi:formyltetrahydrofolate deformylase